MTWDTLHRVRRDTLFYVQLEAAHLHHFLTTTGPRQRSRAERAMVERMYGRLARSYGVSG